jgi:hypothetical protein
MPYTNSLQLSTIQYLDLLDDIPYKYIKNMIDEDDEDYYDVEIADLKCDRIAYCRTQFKLSLKIDIGQGSLPIYVDKTFIIVKEYNNSSGIALTMLDLYEEDSDSDSDEEE